MSLLQSMFTLEPAIVEKVLRPILVYVFLIVGLRLAGKRELAQMNPFDLVVLLTISNTVQNAIIGRDDSVTGGLIGILLGGGIALGMATLLQWTVVVTPFSVILAFGFSAGVGILFGFWPARRASGLAPAEALRSE